MLGLAAVFAPKGNSILDKLFTKVTNRVFCLQSDAQRVIYWHKSLKTFEVVATSRTGEEIVLFANGNDRSAKNTVDKGLYKLPA